MPLVPRKVHRERAGIGVIAGGPHSSKSLAAVDRLESLIIVGQYRGFAFQVGR